MSATRRLLGLLPLAALLTTGPGVIAVTLAGPPRAESPADGTVAGQRGRFAGGDWQRGEPLYRRNCAGCHGPNLKGRGMAPSLVGVTRHMADGAIVAHARRIGEAMCCARHIRNLTDAEFSDIIAYFRAVDTDPAVRRRAERAKGGKGCCCSG